MVVATFRFLRKRNVKLLDRKALKDRLRFMLALCGRSDRREFLALASDVRELSGRFGVPVLDRRDFTAGPILRNVDFFLLLRSFPNEFCVADVERFRRLSPLAPIVTIAGELCEGEDRTGERFPGVRRFYASKWRERGRDEFVRFFDASGATGLFAASPLESEAEFDARRVVGASRRRVANDERALLLSDDATLIALLSDVFNARGVETIARSWERFDPVRSDDFCASRVVVDMNRPIDARLIRKTRELRACFPRTKIVVLTFSSSDSGGERYDEIQCMERVRFVSKPFSIKSLLD